MSMHSEGMKITTTTGLGMEALIPVIGKLQDVFSTIGCRESEVQLPQIVVVGSQSAGKSSVIEGIVGRDFLPRGTGIVTRRPLLLHLVHMKLDDPQRDGIPGAINTGTDWAVFEHKPDVIFTDFDAVRKEIEEETNRLTGTNKGISPLPINLKVFSHRVLSLTLIDLPGITKLPVGDQPADIEMQIRRMLQTYVANPNSLILAVTPANQDFATSEPMKLAKEVDQQGLRTLAVLTKLDLMDQGTDAIDVLTGKLVPVKLGIIGVVNRSQADINGSKDIQACLQDEAKFLLKKYPTLASRNGVPYLAKTLNMLLMNHIRDCLPELKRRVSSMIAQCQSLLQTLGEPIADKPRAMLQIITNFSNAYTSALDGSSKRVQTDELNGGARINHVFFREFDKSLRAVDPMQGLSHQEIVHAIQNTMGIRTYLFVPDITFELLAKRQIRQLEEPSLECVDLVYEELLHLVQCCKFEMEQDVQRFPRLFERIQEILTAVLSSRLAPTKDFVSNLVNIQLAYINNKHPEFETRKYRSTSEAPQDDASAAVTELPENAFDDCASQQVNQALSKQPKQKWYDLLVTPFKKKPSGQAKVKDAVSEAGDPSMALVPNGVVKNGGGGLFITSIFPFGRSNNNKATRSVQAAENTTKAAPIQKKQADSSGRDLTAKERTDCVTIENLIQSYFLIVRKTIQDQVPKAVMYFLVNKIRDSLHNELVRELYNGAKLDELLNESGAMASRRKETYQMLEALKKANSVISEVRETYIR